MTSSTWMPTVPPSVPLSPTQNPFLTPLPPPHMLSVTPRRVVTPVPPLPSYHHHPSPLYQLPLSPRRPLSPLPSLLSPVREKVVNTQPPPHPPPVLWTPSPISTTSVELTPEQHICFVQMLKHLDEWLAQGWQPGADESRLWTLAEIFNAAESVAEGSLCNIRCADLAWRLADSEGWEKSTGSSIMGAIDIQVTVTKILFKDYGEPLIVSFRSFLGRKEAELGDKGRPTGISGPPLSETKSRGNPKPNLSKRVRFPRLDSAPGGARDVHPEWNEGGRLPADKAITHIPTYDEACRSLTQHLAFVSGTTYMEWVNLLLSLRGTTAGANALRSRHATRLLPDGPFTPVLVNNQLRYLLAGRRSIPDTHPLGGFRCFHCNSLGHWSSDHDRSHRSVYGGPPHSGVLPNNAC